MAELTEEIEKAIAGRYTLVHLDSAEEQRIVERLRPLAAQRGLPVFAWTCTRGLEALDNGARTEATQDPADALRHILDEGRPGFYVMKDLPDFSGRPEIGRLLRDLCGQFRGREDLFLFVVSPGGRLPPSLGDELFRIDAGPPGVEEMLAHLRALQDSGRIRKLRDDALQEIAFSLLGLGLNDATHILYQLDRCEKITAAAVSGLISECKRRRISNDGMSSLEYVSADLELARVGGLGRLKEWIEKRKQLFTRKAQRSGMPIPRGILIMGISGCGKSLCAKVVANTWNAPLFRLDMNLLFSRLHGSPEAAFHKITRMVENAAPAVLWIDEIENGLGLLEGGNTNQSHIFSAFLTWMQEKSPLVFVAATANQIESLPAELIRKGRFDQIFFCDLPDEDERAEILRIHIGANRQNPDDFDIAHLVKITKEWNAAELEQAVNGGRIDACAQGHAFTTKDIIRHIDTMVPLSETMKEQIKKIRDWAWDRATPASKGKGRELSFNEAE